MWCWIERATHYDQGCAWLHSGWVWAATFTSAIWTRHCCVYLCHLNQTLLHVPLPSEPGTAAYTSAIWTRHCCVYLCHLSQTLHVPLPSEPDTAACTSAIWARHCCVYLCHLSQTLHVPLPSEPDTAYTSAIWTRHCHIYLCHLNQTLPHLPLPSKPDTATFTSVIWSRHCCTHLCHMNQTWITSLTLLSLIMPCLSARPQFCDQAGRWCPMECELRQAWLSAVLGLPSVNIAFCAWPWKFSCANGPIHSR